MQFFLNVNIFGRSLFKMHGNIQKGCTVIVECKDMPGDSLWGGGGGGGGKYHFGYEYTCL